MKPVMAWLHAILCTWSRRISTRKQQGRCLCLRILMSPMALSFHCLRSAWKMYSLARLQNRASSSSSPVFSSTRSGKGTTGSKCTSLLGATSSSPSSSASDLCLEADWNSLEPAPARRGMLLLGGDPAGLPKPEAPCWASSAKENCITELELNRLPSSVVLSAAATLAGSFSTAAVRRGAAAAGGVADCPAFFFVSQSSQPLQPGHGGLVS
uniref:Uncharacterized protein n=1 Tax=Ixodes ricinus TaxID=34613 RepID=A0A6B0V3D2_IXORI